ncbi:DUF108 domain-containing protein [Mesosutterella sp. OilRF-GAM-744-9]|uniref:L-aspartate dehydrogenase n=1 Tax=Mesosutterella porci TaxID=2915351 RepID=A0ABS9MMX8_9BURK|nr:aspartate dehydrogenase domain-containing protein [Mesosutterella sp. oilRF-744-WT-GAM-9]MCG5029961.1 DUF108 domain-containing protein [Mesosutterella sp. oilRF-744-WT-GAM-9]MCI6530790.1 DUF108 domain-containing protein [Mesosutterella sp.]
MKKIAVIGAGSLAHVFCRHFADSLGGRCRLEGIMSRTYGKTLPLAEEYGARACRTLEELLALEPDYVVEFAGVAALKTYAPQVLRSTSLLAVSAGALADPDFRAAARSAALAGGTRLIIANGAIGGLDLLRTYALMGGAKLDFESRKAPGSLNGAPGLAGRELSKEHEEVAFSGPIEEAIREFPKNVNVAVAARFASGADQSSMTLTSVPGLKETTHRIRIKNALLHAELSFSSRPDPDNPRSSVSAAWSVLACLDELTAPIAFF